MAKCFRVAAMFPGLLAALLLPSLALALDVGAPGRDLELGKTVLGASFSYTSFDIDHSEFSTRAFCGKAAFGVAPGVTPYVRLGFADLSAPGADGTLGLAFGGGVLLRLMTPASPDGLTLLADIQGMRSDSEIGGSAVPLTRFQGAMLGSVRSGGTTAFGGAALASIKADHETDTKSFLFFGLDYFIDFNFFLSAEAHLFGEDTISLGVGYLF
jgi:hypothetical protein